MESQPKVKKAFNTPMNLNNTQKYNNAQNKLKRDNKAPNKKELNSKNEKKIKNIFLTLDEGLKKKTFSQGKNQDLSKARLKLFNKSKYDDLEIRIDVGHLYKYLIFAIGYFPVKYRETIGADIRTTISELRHNINCANAYSKNIVVYLRKADVLLQDLKEQLWNAAELELLRFGQLGIASTFIVSITASLNSLLSKYDADYAKNKSAFISTSDVARDTEFRKFKDSLKEQEG